MQRSGARQHLRLHDRAVRCFCNYWRDFGIVQTENLPSPSSTVGDRPTKWLAGHRLRRVRYVTRRRPAAVHGVDQVEPAMNVAGGAAIGARPPLCSLSSCNRMKLRDNLVVSRVHGRGRLNGRAAPAPVSRARRMLRRAGTESTACYQMVVSYRRGRPDAGAVMSQMRGCAGALGAVMPSLLRAMSTVFRALAAVRKPRKLGRAGTPT